MQEKGYVYILTNPSFRVSIGRLMTVIGAYTKKNPREIGDFSHAAPLSV